MLHFHAPDNRRIGQRIHIQAPVKVAISKKPFWLFLLRPEFSGSLADISVQGMQLTLKQPLPQGASVKIWVQVEYQSKNYNLILRGEVMWSKPGQDPGTFLAGIKLTHLSSPAMQVWAASTLDEIRDFIH
jgi:hypothetical protein